MDYKSFLGKEFEITIDRPIGSAHPKYENLIYPMNYGFINGYKAEDGDDVDVYVLGLNKPVKSIKAEIIAIIHRNDDDEDKLVASIDGKEYSDKEIADSVDFQEKFFKHELQR